MINKKLFVMKKILAILAMSLMAAAAYCETAAPAVEKMNESCPVKMAEGCTLTSVIMGDSALVFLFTIADEM